MSNSSAAQDYVVHLKQQQNTFLSTLSGVLGRNASALFSYQYAYNGMALNLSGNEIAQVKGIPSVLSITLDKNYVINTDVGPQLIGADSIWLGQEPASGLALGEEMVIGTLDTGTNFDHPSFAAIGGDGYEHINPLGQDVYLGVCDSNNVDQYIAEYTCNNKLIGGYDFVHSLIGPGDTDIPGPEDEHGHGSHTSSTSGGNVVMADFNGIVGIPISGVAPHATNIIYDVCFNSTIIGNGQILCPGVSTLAAVDQVLADDIVDVINFSIAGGTSPWTGPVSLAFLNATHAGVFITVAAGNSGPGAATLIHLEPWTTSVGAMTHQRRFSTDLDVTGPGMIPVNLTGVLAIQGTGSAMPQDMDGTVNYAGIVDPTNVDGCAVFEADAFLGQIALISRGNCSFTSKVNNAFTAGAIGVVVHNNSPLDPVVMWDLELTTIPSVMITEQAGLNLADFITSNPGTTISVVSETSTNLNGFADLMASFSSRGPSFYEYNKPDLSAPGKSILAAQGDGQVLPDMAAEYKVSSGTSMASPHTAGAATLLRELKPGWTPMEVKSALMMTAKNIGTFKEDGITPTDPWDLGAGRIQVDVASSVGLVIDETKSNFILADPFNGGDPKTLNAANLTNFECIETCNFQRKLHSVAAMPVTYNAALSGIPGTVNPAQFTVNPDQTVILDIAVDGSALPVGLTSFGELLISEEPTTFGPAVPFAITPNVLLTDGAYVNGSGTLTGMVCETINVSGLTASVFTAFLETTIDHPNSAELTLKVINPNGDILTVMNENGSSGVLLQSSSPVSFMDDAAVSAEDMGITLAGGQVVCLDDGICELAPAPDQEPSPPTTFADLDVGSSANGDWLLCAGDSVNLNEGSLVTATLNIAEGVTTVPPLHMPAVIIGYPAAPEIDVTPTSLAATLDANTMTVANFSIANLPSASADLDWSFGAGIIDYAIYEQFTNGPGGIISNYIPLANTGVYSTDSFVLKAPTDIEKIFFDGFLSDGTDITDELISVTVSIFADAAGVPAGHPEDGMGSELLTVTIPINNSNIDTGDGSGPITIDILTATGSAWPLPVGNYWVTAFGNMSGSNLWNWYQGADMNPGNAQIIDPNDLFGYGLTDWADLELYYPELAALSFKMTKELTCGADWLSTSTNSGTLPPDSDEDVTITLNATDMIPGVYETTLCVDSNDIDKPQVLVLVTMIVSPSDLIFKDGFEIEL